jgi:hypothetical protein
VEDSIIVDGLDLIIGDIHKNLFDVAIRCGVADIIQFQKEGMATASGKLEGVGSEERHLGGAESSLEVDWKQSDLGMAAETDSRQVRVGLWAVPPQDKTSLLRRRSTRIFRVKSLAGGRAQSQKILGHKK